MTAPDLSEDVAASAATPGERVTEHDDGILEIDFRCPENPGNLFFKLKAAGLPPTVTPENLLELPCRHCKQDPRNLHPRTQRRPRMVLHRFYLDGVHAETVAVY